MLVYYVLVFAFVLVALLQKNRKSIKLLWHQNTIYSSEANGHPKNLAVLLFFVVYFLLLSLRRNDIGVDTWGYLRHFHTSEYYGLFDYLKSHNDEHGFYILLKIISSFTSDNQIFIVIISALTVAPIAYFYYKESENQLLTISFFLILPIFPMFFSGLRQSLAIGIVVMSYYFIKERKLLPFVLVILCASMFHQSALIGLLLYPVYYMKLQRKMLLWIIPLLLFVYFNNARLYILAVRFVGIDYFDSYGSVKETGAYMMVLLFVLCLAASYLLLDENRARSETMRLRNILILATVLQFFSASNPIAARLNYYFMIFIPIVLPKIFNEAEGRYKQICTVVSWVMVFYFIFYFFRRAYTGEDILNTFPYYAFWQKTF